MFGLKPNYKQKHCSRLWNGVMIRHDGHIYPCCALGNRPERAIGNINDQKLEDVINNEKITKMREQSLAGELPCYEGCDQVKYYEAWPIPRPKTTRTEIQKLQELQIEYGELCNVDCIMCWQDRSNRVMLSYETLMKNLPQAPWKVVYALGGEVFVMKDATQHIKTLIDQKYNVQITTNGKNLSQPELAKLIVGKCHSINISVNAVTEEMHSFVMRPKVPFFHELIENVKNLQKLKVTLNNPEFNINGHFTTVKETLHEFPLFIEKFQEMGFDNATISFDHRFFPGYFRENPSVVEGLKPSVRKAIQSLRDRNRVTLNHHELFLN